MWQEENIFNIEYLLLGSAYDIISTGMLKMDTINTFIANSLLTNANLECLDRWPVKHTCMYEKCVNDIIVVQSLFSQQ